MTVRSVPRQTGGLYRFSASGAVPYCFTNIAEIDHRPESAVNRVQIGAGSILHIHNFEALSAKNLKCAIFIGVFVNHDCAVSRLFLAGMRGDTRPLKATDTIRHVMSGPMAFTMKDPNLFHAASLPSIAMSISSSMNHSRSDTPAAMAGVTRKLG